MVSKDVPPFCNATGDRARLRGLNLEGLKRRGLTKTVIDALKKAYRIIFQSKLKTKDALETVRREVTPLPEIDMLLDFIAGTSNTITAATASRRAVGSSAGLMVALPRTRSSQSMTTIETNAGIQ